jgi:hypothetical protein
MVSTHEREEHGMVDIDPQLYADFCTARAKAKEFKEQQDRYADEIRRQAGEDEKLTVHGNPIGTYERIKKFAAKAFISARPELAEEFTTFRYVEEIDERKLARMLPEVYQEFQVRQLVIGD